MDIIDISSTIIAKSDQLNADDLLSGPVNVQVEGVNLVDGEQPVSVKITGHRPWKPCKTMRRVLIHAWGSDAAKWRGKWLTLYRDQSVKWAGEEVGGVRIAAMSDIPKPIVVSLTATRGKKESHRVAVLKAPANGDTVAPLDGFLAALAGLSLAAEDVKAWADAEGVDLGTLSRDRLRDLFAGLKPGGSARAKLDAFMGQTVPTSALDDAIGYAEPAAEPARVDPAGTGGEA